MPNQASLDKWATQTLGLPFNDPDTGKAYVAPAPAPADEIPVEPEVETVKITIEK